MKVVIIGAGVAGLAIGWRLAACGYAVDVLERGLAGRASSWAAAGMLAATAETGIADDAHSRLARGGLASWPEFAAALEQASGFEIGFRRSGALLVAASEERANELRDLAKALQERGETALWLTPEQARREEPLLTPDVRGALHATDDAQVDNRILGSALARAFLRAGGRLREHCEVVGLHLTSGRVCGVRTVAGVLSADCVINAAGAWSSRIGCEIADVFPSISPAKGQMVALAPPPGTSMPRHLIWGEDVVYLVPRQDTLLVGATVEDTGYETSVLRSVREALITRATQLVPSLETWRIVESWAGLRPRAADGLPVLGATALPGLYVASGQYRNGILFAPVIAEIMLRLVSGQDPGEEVGAFDPRRFAGA